MKDKQTIIKEYIRFENRQPRGVAVAIRDGDGIRYGYALWNPIDKYSKQKGIDIATNRAMSEKGYWLPDLPERRVLVEDALKRVEERALKYFKDLDPKNVAISSDEMEEIYQVPN